MGLEGEVRSIVQKLSGSGVDRSSIGAIIADGKAHSGFFQQCRFKFITRKGNRAAHYIAKHGFTLENDKFWIDEVPQQVRGAVESYQWWVDPPVYAMTMPIT